MMREVFPCDTCGAETGFCINGVPYCSDHAYAGIGVQARLVASLHGADGEAGALVRRVGPARGSGDAGVPW
jgi:hypothetical protein